MVKTMNLSGKRAISYPELTGKLLMEVIARILSAGTPIKIILFGSRARGDHRPDSDIDLLVVEESGDVGQRASQYRSALAGIYPERTVLVATARDIEEWKFVQEHIITTALCQGRVLYEREGGREQGALPPGDSMRVAEGQAVEYKTSEDLARHWFGLGNDDLKMCKLALENDGPYAQVCFHAQQSAEKYMKGFMGLHAREILRTHSLEDLAHECNALEPMPELLQLPLRGLSDFAIEGRYSSLAAENTARECYELAVRITEIILSRVPPRAVPRPDRRPDPSNWSGF